MANIKKIKNKLGPMLGYNAASIMFGGSTYVISLYLMSYLTEVECLTTGQAGLVFAFAHFWDAVTDPAMGIITDRTRSRFGKHRPYLILGCIPIALAYFMLWSSFGIDTHVSTNVLTVYYIFAYMFFNTSYTLTFVPYTAMLPSIAPEYSLRTQYTSMQYIMNSVGMVSSFVLVSATLGYTDVETLTSSSDTKQKFLMLGVVLAIYYSLPLAITFFTTKEKSSAGTVLPPMNISYTFKEYKLVFKNKAFRKYLAFSTYYAISKSFYNNSNQYFVRYAAQKWSKYNILNTIAGVAEALGFPFNYVITMKKGKQITGKILGPVMLIGLFISLFINKNTPAWVMYLASALYCFGFSGPGFVVTTTQPDITDVDEMITGRRREGIISTFSSLIKKTINGVIAGVTGYMLSVFGFKTGNASSQTAMGIFGVRLTYCILPIIFGVLSIIFIHQYRMTKSDHELIRNVIAQKNENGFVKVNDEEREILEDISGQRFEDMWVGKISKNEEINITEQ